MTQKNIIKSHSTVPASVDHTPDSIQKFVSFWLDEELFGVDILNVKEVTPIMSITPIAHSDNEVEGYVNIRGVIHLVINLRNLMGLPFKARNADCRIVIFKTIVAEPFGILVDAVGDVIEIDQKLIEPYIKDRSNQQNTSFITGVSKLNKNLLILLDAHQLLKTKKEA